MKKSLFILSVLLCYACNRSQDYVGLTVIPYGTVTDMVDLDIRSGLINRYEDEMTYVISVSINGAKDTLIHSETITLKAGEKYLLKKTIPTAGLLGDNEIKLKVTDKRGVKHTRSEKSKVVSTGYRSDNTIDGAWCGIYHWSEVEGKMWNKDIKLLTDKQWMELVASMHSVGMDAIIIQEVFRNEYYVGRHDLDLDNYEGKAFYPSSLYPGRMEIAANDPIEAILASADKNGMHVMVGVGMFAWFDFTQTSLEWHKRVAKELFEMYGHHKSFYGFYVSEECDGSLTTYDATSYERTIARKTEIVEFFKEFKEYVGDLAPDKPVMLATNSFNINHSLDTYQRLLENLDILCPFGFARMPEWDMTGEQAAGILQALCNEAGAHLWFDLESFLFNPDMSLYPKPIDQIISELNLFDNFEKVLCYQFPGVFNGPEMSRQVGEDRTIALYNDYKTYYESVIAKQSRVTNNKRIKR